MYIQTRDPRSVLDSLESSDFKDADAANLDPGVLLEQRREVRLLRVLHADRTAHHALIPQHVVLEPLVRGDDVQRLFPEFSASSSSGA